MKEKFKSISQKIALAGAIAAGVAAGNIEASAQAPERMRLRSGKPTVEKQESVSEKFEKISASYKTFDDANEDAIKAQLQLYIDNDNLHETLSLEQKSEFFRQWAFVEFSLVAHKYGFKLGQDPWKDIHPAVLEKYELDREKDTATLERVLRRIDLAIAHLNTAPNAQSPANADQLLKLDIWKRNMGKFADRIRTSNVFK